MSNQQYQISGPALHAARTVWRNWIPRETSTYEATLRNVALMIDAATKIYQLQQQIDRLVAIAPWGKSRIHELQRNMEEIREVIELVRLTHEQMQAGYVHRTAHQTPHEGAWQQYQQSEQARRAARLLWKHYAWEKQPFGKLPPTEKNIAIVIDVCIDTWRANVSLPLLLQESGWINRDFGDNFRALRRALQAMELLRDRAPRVAPGVVGEPLAGYRPRQQEPSRQQREAWRPVAEALEKARTVEESVQVMKKAGIIGARS